jgi:hypothetical protein
MVTRARHLPAPLGSAARLSLTTWLPCNLDTLPAKTHGRLPAVSSSDHGLGSRCHLLLAGQPALRVLVEVWPVRHARQHRHGHAAAVHLQAAEALFEQIRTFEQLVGPGVAAKDLLRHLLLVHLRSLRSWGRQDYPAPPRSQRGRERAFIMAAKLPWYQPVANATNPAARMMYRHSCSASFWPLKSMAAPVRSAGAACGAADRPERVQEPKAKISVCEKVSEVAKAA